METFSALLAIFAGNSPVPGEIPTQRPVTRSFDVFFDQRPYKRLSRQWWDKWFETPSRPLWRHGNGGFRQKPSPESLLTKFSDTIWLHCTTVKEHSVTWPISFPGFPWHISHVEISYLGVVVNDVSCINKTNYQVFRQGAERSAAWENVFIRS